MAARYAIAEQMGVACRSGFACNNCTTLLGFMRENARFTLKMKDTSGRLAFGKEMKVLNGGLIGLQRLLEENADGRVRNIHALVQQAQTAYGSLGSIPYREIVKFIAAYQIKRRGGARPAR
ncbi:MAG: hypothetical protein ACYC9K_07730 [Sulfuricaulis sp.]